MGNELKVIKQEDLKVFNFNGAEIRVIDMNGEAFFIARDASTCLGYTDPDQAIRAHVDKRNLISVKITGIRGRHSVFINQSGLYELILSSKLPSAKAFKFWVTNTVLPQIMNTGKYDGSSDPEYLKNATYARADQLCTSERAHLNALVRIYSGVTGLGFGAAYHTFYDAFNTLMLETTHTTKEEYCFEHNVPSDSIKDLDYIEMIGQIKPAIQLITDMINGRKNGIRDYNAAINKQINSNNFGVFMETPEMDQYIRSLEAERYVVPFTIVERVPVQQAGYSNQRPCPLRMVATRVPRATADGPSFPFSIKDGY